jgi:SAM-dependent methyltransferase
MSIPNFSRVVGGDRHLEACYSLSDAELRADFTLHNQANHGADADSLLALRMPYVCGLIAGDRNHGSAAASRPATGRRKSRPQGNAGHAGRAKFENDFFDVIRSTNMIEHPPDPKATFSEIQRILKSNRIVYITASNTRSFVFACPATTETP